MDIICQWLWSQFGRWYPWAVYVLVGIPIGVYITCFVVFPVLVIEGSDQYLGGFALALVGASVQAAFVYRPASRRWRPIARWAAGDRSNAEGALEATYAFGRRLLTPGPLGGYVLCGAGLAAAAGLLAGADDLRALQYAAVGATVASAVVMVAIHTHFEALLTPPRAALLADLPAGVGDDLPRRRPTFTHWAISALLGTAVAFATVGMMLGLALHGRDDHPLLIVGIAVVLLALVAAPITVGTGFSPMLGVLAQFAQATERIRAGDFSHEVPVVLDNDLGVLAASINRMQAGLAQRERLRAAFGSYVDPALATRLLEQGEDSFTGERTDVTVMFVDIRDFTPFAEANTAEAVVDHLNALFEVVVPAVHAAGGHVNKYLGDGALAVFGAPNRLEAHADAAVSAAVTIAAAVRERFEGQTRIGIGINSGEVIAGTLGGGGKLEFTLIGDAVNVAARVEQVTKDSGDTILLTQATLDALIHPPDGLLDRGIVELKGKAGGTHVHAVVRVPALEQPLP